MNYNKEKRTSLWMGVTKSSILSLYHYRFLILMFYWNNCAFFYSRFQHLYHFYNILSYLFVDMFQCHRFQYWILQINFACFKCSTNVTLTNISKISIYPFQDISATEIIWSQCPIPVNVFFICVFKNALISIFYHCNKFAAAF